VSPLLVGAAVLAAVILGGGRPRSPGGTGGEESAGTGGGPGTVGAEPGAEGPADDPDSAIEPNRGPRGGGLVTPTVTLTRAEERLIRQGRGLPELPGLSIEAL